MSRLYLQDPKGANLEKWRMCSPEDEPLILQVYHTLPYPTI